MIIMTAERVPKFKMAWTWLEALLRTNKYKKVPIKRFFSARYARLFTVAAFEKKVDDVYDVRNDVDHKDKKQNPDLDMAL